MGYLVPPQEIVVLEGYAGYGEGAEDALKVFSGSGPIWTKTSLDLDTKSLAMAVILDMKCIAKPDLSI